MKRLIGIFPHMHLQPLAGHDIKWSAWRAGSYKGAKGQSRAPGAANCGKRPPNQELKHPQNGMAHGPMQPGLCDPEPHLGSTPRSSTPFTQISRAPRKLTRDEPMCVAIAASSSSLVSRPSSSRTCASDDALNLACHVAAVVRLEQHAVPPIPGLSAGARPAAAAPADDASLLPEPYRSLASCLQTLQAMAIACVMVS